MVMRLVFCLLLSASICGVLAQPKLEELEGYKSENYSHSVLLDPALSLRLVWKFDETHIIFEVWGRTAGWIGIGISPHGGMIGEDIFVGWVKDGEAFITDRYGASSNSYPPKDSSQDVDLLYGLECDGWTGLRFRRQLAACDKNEDSDITAMGDTDPSGRDIDVSNYHGFGATNRGTKSILLLNGPQELPRSAEPSSLFDLFNDSFTLPLVTTYYNCKLFKLPEFASKVHVTKVEQMIASGNEELVHHMVAWQCLYLSPQTPSSLTSNHACYETTNVDIKRCVLLFHGWAVGGTVFSYPLDSGFPLGTKDSPKYLVMEIHYNNPTLRADIVDNSGFRVHFTSALRLHDAAVLEVGAEVNPYSIIIPPGLDNFNVYGECKGECLAAGMLENSSSDIKVFGVMLYSHLLGRKIALRHVLSNGTEVAPIVEDNNYDFNFQETRSLKPEVVVTSGSHMQLVCAATAQQNEVQWLWFTAIHGVNGNLSDVMVLGPPAISGQTIESYINSVSRATPPVLTTEPYTPPKATCTTETKPVGRVRADWASCSGYGSAPLLLPVSFINLTVAVVLSLFMTKWTLLH